MEAVIIPEDKEDYDIENLKMCLYITSKNSLKRAMQMLTASPERIVSLRIDVSLVEEQDCLDMINCANAKEKPIQFVSYAQYWLENYDKALLSTNVKADKQYIALYNGFLVGRSGEYANIPLNGYAKHIEISKEDLNEKVFARLSEFCSVNSSIFIKDTDCDLNEKVLIHKDTMDQTLYFHEFRSALEEKRSSKQSNPINLITKDSSGRLFVNDAQYEDHIHVQFKTYAEMKALEEPEADTCYFVRIADKESMKCFMEDAENFLKNNNLKDSPLMLGKLENGCRFITRNFCSIDRLPRFTVDSEGVIYPCFEKTEALGTLDDSYFEVVQRAYVNHENKLRERDCINCSANSWCPKCTMLPDYIDDYCDIMKNKTYITDYILESRMLVELTRKFAIFKDKKPEEFYLSNEYSQYNVKDERKGTEIPYFNKYVCIVTCDDNYVFWVPTRGRFFRVGKVFAIIGECLLKRWKVSEIKEFLLDGYLSSKEEVDSVCSVAFAKFKETGMLHRNIE